MQLVDQVIPVAMTRVAVVALEPRLRDVLREVADSGMVELELDPEVDGGELLEAMRRLEQADAGASERPPRLSPEPPQVEDLERRGRWDLLAGELELERRQRAAVPHRSLRIAVGWMREADLEALAERLAPVGGTALRLPRPAWSDPPTLLPERPATRGFRPLVTTYGTARPENVDPTPFAAASIVLMFGMMFGDLGHGLLLAGLGLGLRLLPLPSLARLRRVWALPFTAGLTAAAFGALYGEFFGPTGLLPPLWLHPLEDPIRLLAAGVSVGAGLLAVSYLIGSWNRWREGGFVRALLAGSGIAGLLVFAGASAAVGGLLLGSRPLQVAGVIAGGSGMLLLYLGLLAHAGAGAAGVVQSIVELFDAILRLGGNAVSFARLAAFGLVHAAIGQVVWTGVTALWGPGWRVLPAIFLFLIGNALAFCLEALAAGVQALRLEYYELFSRIFSSEGRPFRPWHTPIDPRAKEVS
jgi:V/A-type H+-transporting ATPase subunit I